MAIWRAKHQQSMPQLPGNRQVVDYVVLEPVAGINRDHPPQHLSTQDAWEADNLHLEDGAIRVRSGLSKHASSLSRGFSETCLLACRWAGYVAFRSDSVDSGVFHEYGLFISGRTSQYYNFTKPSETSFGGMSRWSTGQGFVTSAQQPQNVIRSSSTTAYYDWTVVNERVVSAEDIPGLTIRKVFACNGWDALAIYGYVTSPSSNTGVVIQSVHTGVFDGSAESFPVNSPRYCRFIDERLVIFGDTGRSDSTPQPITVQWSQRGKPFIFDAEDSGWQALPQLDGVGSGLAVDSDTLLVFTDREVLLGSPRRDVFAFDFTGLNNATGTPYSRTIVETPVGVLYLGTDLRIYRVHQGRVYVHSDTRAILQHAVLTDQTALFAAFDMQENKYVLFYPDVSGQPNRALVVPLAGSVGLTTWTAPGSLRWCGAIAMFDPIHSLGTHRPSLTVMMSDGSIYRFRSDQSDDNGTTLVGRLRPPTLSNDWRHTEPLELYIDHQSSSSGSLQVQYSTDMFASTPTSLDTVVLPRSFGTAATAGTITTHIPMTVGASRYPQLEFRLVGANRISRILMTLRRYTGKSAA